MPCEHLWTFSGGGVTAAGVWVLWACSRCAAWSLGTDATMNPGRDVPGLEDDYLTREC